MRRLLTAIAASIIATAMPIAVSSAFGQTAAPPTDNFTFAPAGGASAGAPATALLPLAAGGDDLLFTGESQKRTIVFVAQAAQTAGINNLLLNLQSAISDAPESSRLTVALNDQQLGTMPLRAGDPYTLRLQVPPGLIQPGYNALTVTVDQAHRVDCSVDATYELWTRINPQLSGIEYVASIPAQNSFNDLLGMVRMDGGSTDIRGLIAPGASGPDRDRLLKTIQALSIAAGLDRPKVAFASSSGTGPGIDVAVGSQRGIGDLLATHGITTGLRQGINVLRDPNGRIVLAVIGEDAADIDRQIDTLGSYASQATTGAPAGIAALAQLRGTPLGAGEKVSFSALGFDDRTFSGRLFKQSMQFRMPADFYPADYARAGIHLDALYARGLTNGAQLLVKLNGKTVSTLLLGGSRTGEIKDQILPVSLMAFRPGLNSMSIEARLPTAADIACDPAHVNDGGGRLRIAGTSFIELPDLARVGRFPDLAALDGSITGRQADAPLDVVVSDAAAMNAAGTFLAKLAYTSNRVVEARLISSGAYDPNSPTLVVGNFDTVPMDLMQGIHLDLGGPLQSLATPDASIGAIADPALTPAAPSWADQIRDSTAHLPGFVGTQAVQVAHDVRAALYGLGTSVGVNIELLRPSETDTAFTPNAATKLLVTQRTNASGTVPLTLIAAPQGTDIQFAVEQLAGSREWTQLAGSTITLSDTGDVLQAMPVRGAQLYVTQSPSLTNGRLIAAGWLSNNPAIYVGLLFIFAAMLGISTGLVLWRGRGRAR